MIHRKTDSEKNYKIIIFEVDEFYPTKLYQSIDKNMEDLKWIRPKKKNKAKTIILDDSLQYIKTKKINKKKKT